jgi:hypothetical protein
LTRIHRAAVIARAVLVVLLAVSLALIPGCWHDAGDVCSSCRVFDLLNPRSSIAVAPRGRALVILVHGAFGFGDEWTPVVERVRAHRDLDLVVVAWRGPWSRPRAAARSLLRLVQGVLDRAPSTTGEILVIAHSAGGMITDYMARRLRIPTGRHVSAALVASPELRPIDDGPEEDAVNTPLGLPVGRDRAPVPTASTSSTTAPTIRPPRPPPSPTTSAAPSAASTWARAPATTASSASSACVSSTRSPPAAARSSPTCRARERARPRVRGSPALRRVIARESLLAGHPNLTGVAEPLQRTRQRLAIETQHLDEVADAHPLLRGAHRLEDAPIVRHVRAAPAALLVAVADRGAATPADSTAGPRNERPQRLHRAAIRLGIRQGRLDLFREGIHLRHRQRRPATPCPRPSSPR